MGCVLDVVKQGTGQVGVTNKDMVTQVTQGLHGSCWWENI